MDDTHNQTPPRDINTLACGALPMEDFYMPDNNDEEEAGGQSGSAHDIE